MSTPESQFFEDAAKDPRAAERYRAAGKEKTAETIDMIRAMNARREAEDPEAGS